jgi:hypothetical protein
MTLQLFGRPTGDRAHDPLDLSYVARNYRRISRSVGGWYSGSFAVSDVPRHQLQHWFNTWIGQEVRELVFGLTAWQGLIYRLQLTIDGSVYEISLDPDSWHNNVIVYYSDLAVEDTEQGTLSYLVVDTEQGTLSYTDESGDDTFTDDAQDFTDWDTDDGDAYYRIEVINADGTVTWAYLSTTVSATEIYVTSDIARTTYGWNGEDPTGKTPATYNVVPVGAFKDTGQDFNDWETLGEEADAAYRLQVANSDNTESWGYIGEATSATDVFVFTGIDRSQKGWNGEDPAGKTPEHYEVISVENYGVRKDTDWASNADSVAEHGEMEYLITLPGSQPTPATALRDKELTEYAWPRPRFIGVSNEPDSLAVTLAGYWSTLYWRYKEQSRTAGASTLIEWLASAAEFVSVGRVESNTMELTGDAFPMPQRIGDIAEWITEQGDASGNIWKCGVYEDRELVYEQAPTTVDYVWRDGRLLNKAGQPVVPQLLKPGFYVRTVGALGAAQPPGTSNVWDDPQVAYVDEVEWDLDRRELTLSFRAAGPSLILRQQILAGSA